MRKRTRKNLIRIQTAIMAVFLVCLNIFVQVGECYATQLSDSFLYEENKLTNGRNNQTGDVQTNVNDNDKELADAEQINTEQSEDEQDKAGLTDTEQPGTEQSEIESEDKQDEIEQSEAGQTEIEQNVDELPDVEQNDDEQFEIEQNPDEESETEQIDAEQSDGDETVADVNLDEETVMEISQNVMPEMLSGQSSDDLFEEYVNEVMFQQLGVSDILQQSEIADGEEGNATGNGINFREAVAMYAAPAMANNGFNLNDLQRVMVDAIATFARRVADGEITDTNLVISFVEGTEDSNHICVKNYPGNVFYYEDMGVAGPEEAKRKILSDCIAFQKVFDAATYNNPYLFYWNDKTGGTMMSVSLGAFPDRMRIKEIKISFSVTADYSSGTADSEGRYYKTNIKKTSAAKKAVLEAKRVVAENADRSDYYKLCAYRDYIYSAVTYDYSAMRSDSYGGPWQLINVFDKNESTNVVCEGYSKAFKYLCDLTDFDDDNISCALMGGYMSSGGTPQPHMWNILTMPDGKRYLVDLTNSDNGNTGNGYLFLKGYIETGVDSRVPENCQNSYYRYASRYSSLKFYAFTKFEEYYAGTDMLQLSQTDYIDNHVHQYVKGYCVKCNAYYSSDIVLEGCSLKVGDAAVLSVFISDAGEWITDSDNYIKLEYKNGTSKMIKVSEAVGIKQSGKDMLMIDCSFDMRQLADVVKITFHDAEGNGYYRDKGPEKGKPITYNVSVKDYAARLMSTECETGIKNCLNTILYYGGAVQKYTNYNTGNLVSAGAESAHIKTISDRDMKSLINKNPVEIQYFNSNRPVTYKGIRMSFADKTVMKVYLSFTQNADAYEFYVNGREMTVNKDSFGYYVAVDNIMPTNYSKFCTVTVKSGGSSVLEVKASPYNWVRMTLNGENGSTAALMATARYVYYLGRYGKNE